MPDSEDPIRTLRRIADDVGQVHDEARKSGSISFDNLCLLVPEDATISEFEELIAVLEARGILLVAVDEYADEPLEADDEAMLEALRDFIMMGQSIPLLLAPDEWEKLARSVDRKPGSQPPTGPETPNQSR